MKSLITAHSLIRNRRAAPGKCQLPNISFHLLPQQRHKGWLVVCLCVFVLCACKRQPAVNVMSETALAESLQRAALLFTATFCFRFYVINVLTSCFHAQRHPEEEEKNFPLQPPACRRFIASLSRRLLVQTGSYGFIQTSFERIWD